LNEFIEYLEEHDIIIKFINNYECEYKYFIDIIINVDNNISTIIYDYKKIYTRTMDILLESQKQIISFIKKTSNYKKLIPKWFDNTLNLHIQNYKSKHTLSNIQKILNKSKNI
jgi:hypothetical protein